MPSRFRPTSTQPPAAQQCAVRTRAYPSRSAHEERDPSSPNTFRALAQPRKASRRRAAVCLVRRGFRRYRKVLSPCLGDLIGSPSRLARRNFAVLFGAFGGSSMKRARLDTPLTVFRHITTWHEGI